MITITDKVKYIQLVSDEPATDGLGRITDIRIRKELCQDFLRKDNSPIVQIIMATGGQWSIDFNKVLPPVADAVALQDLLEGYADLP